MTKKPVLIAASSVVAVMVVVAAFFALPGLATNTGTNEKMDLKGHVLVVATHADGTEFFRYEQHNLVVDAGKNFARTQLGSDSPSSSAMTQWIALTNTAITPGAGDTCLSGEITANGLSRAEGAYATTGTAGQFTITKTFTASGTQSAQAAGLFTAAVTGTPCNNGDDGTLFAENTFTQVNLVTNDQLTVTWTVST